jgi:hypothetical protein
MTNDRLKEITAELNRSTSDEIVGVGYGFKTINGKSTNERTIVFTVIRKKPLSEIPENERIPSQITIDGETFSTDVIEGTNSPFAFGYCDPSFYDWQSTPPENRAKHRPLIGGISVTNFTALGNYVGTLGFIAVDNDTNSLVAISNNHVLCDDAFFTTERNLSGVKTNVFTPSGHSVTQPNEVGDYGLSNTIGIVKKYQPLLDVPASNKVDCAAISLEFIDPEEQQTIDISVSWNQFGITGMTSAPRFATTEELDAIFENPEQIYYSAGRTTGAKGEGDTKLFCTAYSTSAYLEYEKQGSQVGVYMDDTFELQASGSTTQQGDWCYYPSNAGDSGSAILCELETDRGSEWVIVGLLYGGRSTYDPVSDSFIPTATLCNRIDNVSDALNIRAWDGTLNGIAFSNNSRAKTYVTQASSSDKFLIIDGEKYWQMGLVVDSEYPTSTPVPTNQATPVPTSTPNPTNDPTPNPTSTPAATPNPTSTSTPQPFTLIYGYEHTNSCTTSVSEIYYNGVQDGTTMNLTQGSTGNGNLRVAVVYPGDQILIKYRPFNLTFPCTQTYTAPSTRLELNGVSVGSTNFDTQNYATYSYTVQQGVNPNFVIVMENSLVPTATPAPTYTLTLQNATGGECAKGYIYIEKNGTEVARMTKTQTQTSASWNTSSVTFTQSDTVYVKSFSQGGGGAGCVNEDTRVRSVVDGVTRTTSEALTGTNNQGYLLPDSNHTITGHFIAIGGL